MSLTGDESQLPDQSTAAERPSAKRRGAGAVREVCPYLRDASGSWRSAYASRDHRCSAVQPAAQLAVTKQRSLCLVSAHETCATYVLARELALGVGPARGVDDDAALWPDVHATPLLLEPTRGLRAAVPRGAARTEGQALLVGLMILAFVVLVIARTASPDVTASPGPGSSTGAIRTTTPSATATSGPSAVASVVPSSSPLPTVSPAPTPAATPLATPAATPLLSGTQRYTVKLGDTLSGIAAKFGTTVTALAAANGIADPRLVRVGQVLIIP